MEGIPTDVAAWFASIPALAAVVASFVALIRKHIATKLDGKVVIGLSVVVAEALAFGGNRLGFLGNDWAYFGLMAGLTASGGVDLVKGFTDASAKSTPGKRRVL